jgi:hypothetical protein
MVAAGLTSPFMNSTSYEVKPSSGLKMGEPDASGSIRELFDILRDPLRSCEGVFTTSPDCSSSAAALLAVHELTVAPIVCYCSKCCTELALYYASLCLPSAAAPNLLLQLAVSKVWKNRFSRALCDGLLASDDRKLMHT